MVTCESVPQRVMWILNAFRLREAAEVAWFEESVALQFKKYYPFASPRIKKKKKIVFFKQKIASIVKTNSFMCLEKAL